MLNGGNMSTKLQFKRGISPNFDTVILENGEPAFVTDSGKLFIGNGTDNILINPIDKPNGIDTQNEYPKIQVNEYGQVISQSNLTPPDIPPITSDKITDLGTAAKADIGISQGNIPKLD